MRAQLDDLNRVAADITDHLHRALADLFRIRTHVLALLDVVEREGQGHRPSRAHLGGIRGSLQACLRHPDHPMDRIGVATAVDYLVDSPYWMEWWGYDGQGDLEYVGHSLNPRQDTFYDYSSRSWFSVPATLGTTSVIGPYVDVSGINSYTYTVTISVPISTAHGFAGVTGADILADRFEGFLLAVDRDRSPATLINADRRVIASNTSRHLPGELLPGSDMAAWTRLEVAQDVFPHGRSWQLVTPTA
ncbi:PDC sensor domain-containing protein [Kocuria nitroreducens]|uniref:PDC sensor domain-containing protein n=1 Tax=Kocuria nitroreducens TaxID=3058914 RepID=UPI0036D94BCF